MEYGWNVGSSLQFVFLQNGQKDGERNSLKNGATDHRTFPEARVEWAAVSADLVAHSGRLSGPLWPTKVAHSGRLLSGQLCTNFHTVKP